MHHSRLPHSLPRMSGAPEGWHHADGKLHREFEFKDFAEAFGFMTMVAMLAERRNGELWKRALEQTMPELPEDVQAKVKSIREDFERQVREFREAN
ncbi:MAG: hypothetical protein EBR06_06165, partial [Acidimicrobiia bacterium]|nr:hypothetical protein [Acidimicrobiia bacterium]